MTPKKTCLLIVEDHRDTLDAFCKLLTFSGYVVCPAKSIAEARDVAGKNNFDLMIADIHLPDGNGCDLMRELNIAYGLPGIAISADVYPERRAAAFEAGFDAFLAKPFGIDQLLSAIRRTLELQTNLRLSSEQKEKCYEYC